MSIPRPCCSRRRRARSRRFRTRAAPPMATTSASRCTAASACSAPATIAPPRSSTRAHPATPPIRCCRSSFERYADAYRLELDAFITAVLDGKPLAPTGEDGLRAQLLADAATEAAKIRTAGAAYLIMAGSDLNDRLTAACAVAREAGAVALEAFRQAPQSRARAFKGPQDYVLESDAEVERVIRERLAAAFPKDSFFGEEARRRIRQRRLGRRPDRRHREFRARHSAFLHLDRLRARRPDRDRRDLPAGARRALRGPARRRRDAERTSRSGSAASTDMDGAH